jgi:hypothetical protein
MVTLRIFRPAWKAENGKINPGDDSAKSIFSGDDQGRGRGGSGFTRD